MCNFLTKITKYIDFFTASLLTSPWPRRRKFVIKYLLLTLQNRRLFVKKQLLLSTLAVVAIAGCLRADEDKPEDRTRDRKEEVTEAKRSMAKVVVADEAYDSEDSDNVEKTKGKKDKEDKKKKDKQDMEKK